MEKKKLLFNGYRVFARNGEKALCIDSGDGYTTSWMYLMLQNCTLMDGKMINTMLYVLYLNKEKERDENVFLKNRRAHRDGFSSFTVTSRPATVNL